MKENVPKELVNVAKEILRQNVENTIEAHLATYDNAWEEQEEIKKELIHFQAEFT